MTSYADGPAGPASDTEIAANAGKADGPGAEAAGQSEPAGGGQNGQAQSAGEASQKQEAASGGQPQDMQPEASEAKAENAGQENAQETAPQSGTLPETAQPQQVNGLVLSGGRYLDPNGPMIALTFDDGPYAPVGNRIMDSLEQHNGRATFFVVGNRVPSYQTEIRRMHDNGHEIGNHTYAHKYLNKLNAAQIQSQIELCNQMVASVTGEAPKLVRLPGGNKNSTVLANVHYPIIMWNIDTLDWKTRDAAKTVQAVLGRVKDGDVVLMHELYSASGDAAVAMIPALVEQGFQLVTVSELAQFRGGAAAGGVYYSFSR